MTVDERPNDVRRTKNLKYLFKLDDQVQHMLDFVREQLPMAQKIYILGQSIGAYMMLRILPNCYCDALRSLRDSGTSQVKIACDSTGYCTMERLPRGHVIMDKDGYEQAL
ncbi:hypothetical protein KIN20_033013 [Parelaphostrongylus tenuis]|uniref:Lipid droplet-associated hydrolase n=1 Tax=Parelaphostrongylus tenuis TaxID=148309 RepID=A0AAD5R7L1_PARTN|nr:hypothetical protein KIN20_033013 [Parelaphostrongylus tenuis]